MTRLSVRVPTGSRARMPVAGPVAFCLFAAAFPLPLVFMLMSRAGDEVDAVPVMCRVQGELVDTGGGVSSPRIYTMPGCAQTFAFPAAWRVLVAMSVLSNFCGGPFLGQCRRGDLGCEFGRRVLALLHLA